MVSLPGSAPPTFNNYPTAPATFYDYLTSVLPSDSLAYSQLDTPCPRSAFVTAFASLRTKECIFYSESAPSDRVNCMCDLYQSQMIATVQALGPGLCGTQGPLASYAIASGTQAVKDVCTHRSNIGYAFSTVGSSAMTITGVAPSSLYTSYTYPYSNDFTRGPFLSKATVPPLFQSTDGARATTSPAFIPSAGVMSSSGGGYYTGSYGGDTDGTGNGYGYGEKKYSGLSGGAIAGIVFGVVLFVFGVVGIVLVVFSRKRRRRLAQEADQLNAVPEITESAPTTDVPGVMQEYYAPEASEPGPSRPRVQEYFAPNAPENSQPYVDVTEDGPSHGISRSSRRSVKWA